MSKIHVTNELQDKIRQIEDGIKNYSLNNQLIFAPNGVGKSYTTKKYTTESPIENLKYFEVREYIKTTLQEGKEVIINFKNHEIVKLQNERGEIKTNFKDNVSKMEVIVKSIKARLRNEFNITKVGQIKNTIIENIWKKQNLSIESNLDMLAIEKQIDEKELKFIKNLILQNDESKEHSKKLLENHNLIKELLMKIKESETQKIKEHKSLWLKENVDFDDVINNFSECEYDASIGNKYKNKSQVELINIYFSTADYEKMCEINKYIASNNELKIKISELDNKITELKKKEDLLFSKISSSIPKLEIIFKQIIQHNKNVNIIITANNDQKTINIDFSEEIIMSTGEHEAITFFCNLMYYINDTSNSQIQYIIFDDPITSIDSTNLEYFVYIFNDIMLNYKQNFKFIILTHYVSLFESFFDQLGNNNSTDAFIVGILPDDNKTRDLYEDYINLKTKKFKFALENRKKILDRELSINEVEIDNNKTPFVDDLHYYFKEEPTEDLKINELDLTRESVHEVKNRLNMINDYLENKNKIQNLEIKYLIITSIRVWIEKNICGVLEQLKEPLQPTAKNGVKLNYIDFNKGLKCLEKKLKELNDVKLLELFIDFKTKILISKTLFNKLVHSTNYINTYETLLSTTDLKIYNILTGINESFKRLNDAIKEYQK